MKVNNDVRTGRNCVFNLHVHLVFVTKYRRDVFSGRVLIDLEEIFKNVCLDFEAELVEFNGEHDHIHLLVNYPPKIAISNLVNSLKGVSSRLIRKKNYPEIKNKVQHLSHQQTIHATNLSPARNPMRRIQQVRPPQLRKIAVKPNPAQHGLMQ
ncbi:Transposase IS200 like [Nitrosomonas cryotolerans ATCC 49181]|uniref:Transposase IS200 like n=1 Tax=Nitrosomonas cryotolerans ATCC 49181 TaxID=1131553 RepID=A0A1N6FIU0_9PROT|nr:Transposase IS200 like [Nitrosomonas cryotolerans ATCC 49181]